MLTDKEGTEYHSTSSLDCDHAFPPGMLSGFTTGEHKMLLPLCVKEEVGMETQSKH